ncbi:hypothetical protein THS27_15805 [Thalassospira sp. MCCC 1A01428]|jgi:hypothetical protein|nr:hypothetical protein THS27_15805 [Thalassospira sp. MCCC 1A01428]
MPHLWAMRPILPTVYPIDIRTKTDNFNNIAMQRTHDRRLIASFGGKPAFHGAFGQPPAPKLVSKQNKENNNASKQD